MPAATLPLLLCMLMLLLLLLAQGACAMIYWGAQQPPGHNPDHDWNAFLGDAKRGASIRGTVATASAPFDPQGMSQIRSYGAIPLVSFEPREDDPAQDPSWSLAAVANGTHDKVFEDWATAARWWGHPFFFRFAPRMNSGDRPWSVGAHGNTAEDFLAAWAHVRGIFQKMGATAANFVWSPQVGPSFDGDLLASLWPGEDMVDWVCLEGYNTNVSGAADWIAPDDLVVPAYKVLQQKLPNVPLMLQLGCSEPQNPHTSDTFRKSFWISRALINLVPKLKGVQALLWYNGEGLEIETDSGSVVAFAAAINCGHYTANVFSNLNTPKITPLQ